MRLRSIILQARVSFICLREISDPTWKLYAGRKAIYHARLMSIHEHRSRIGARHPVDLALNKVLALAG